MFSNLDISTVLQETPDNMPPKSNDTLEQRKMPAKSESQY